MESNLGSYLFTISLIIYGLSTTLYILYVVLKKEQIGKLATWLLAAGLVCHTIALVLRTIEVKHAPFVTTYESLAFWSWLIALVYLILHFRYRIRILGALVTTLAFLAIAAASLLLPEGSQEAKPLMPALQSHWLEFHIATCFIGYACFAVSFIMSIVYLIDLKRFIASSLIIFLILISFGVIYLIQLTDVLFSVEVNSQNELNNEVIPENLQQEFRNNDIMLSNRVNVSVEKADAKWLITDMGKKYIVKKKQGDKLNIYLPVKKAFIIFFWISLCLLILLAITYLVVNRTNVSKDSMDMVGYKAISIGFPFLTLGIISGAMWANVAWGAYWQWDPKETWSLITWFVYAIYLHLRVVAKWKGKYTAIVSVIGFAAVMFTYLGVNYLPVFSGLHSYG